MTDKDNNVLYTKNGSKITAFSFSTIQLPVTVERPGRDWVPFGGDNLFPQFLIDLYNKSAIHRRCIDAKSEAASANGFIIKNDPSKNYLLKRANPKESWSEVLTKASLDYCIHGEYAFNVIWSRDGKTISEIYHMDVSKIRPGKTDDKEENEEPSHYWYSFDWRLPRRFRPSCYVAYCPEVAKAAVEQGGNTENLSQILFVKNTTPGQFYYALPTYQGAINDVQLDIKITEFHLSNISNGMTTSLWIHFPAGVPTDEEQKNTFESISSQYAGSENGGKFIVTYSDGNDTAPQITPISLTNDTYYITLEERVSSRILSAHGISSPLLLGLRVGSSGLGSNADEINVAWQLFEFTVVKKIQTNLLNTFNMLLHDYGYPDLELDIVPRVIFQSNSEVTEVDPNKQAN